MQLLKNVPTFNFLGRRRLAAIISVVLILGSFAAIGIRGLNLGIDFTGGVLVEALYKSPADLPAIRSALVADGFEKAQVQNFGTAREVLVRLPPAEDGQSQAQISSDVADTLGAVESFDAVRRVEFVGPQIGEELTEQSGLAMLFALIMIFGYVVLRFQWRYAVGAIAALVHDVVLTVGAFAVFRFPFDLSVLAAVLAVIGYSLNDTIVEFDRIRENFRNLRTGSTEEIMNLSVNQMLARTLITGATTLLVLVALYFLGGQAVNAFAIALIIGIIVGTYSSIYVAAAVALSLGASRLDLVPPKPEEMDDMP
jgi:preprotein translocase subunit SecF